MIHSDDLDHLDVKELRRKAEKQQESEEESTEDLSPSEKSELIQKLRIHKLELEMQNQELREIHQQLLVSRNAYYELWEHAPVGYLLLDRGGRIRTINRAGRKLFGSPGNELLHKPLISLADPESRIPIQLMLENFAGAEKNEKIKIDISRPDGTSRHCLLSLRFSETGSDLVQAVLTDITERDELEHTLREKEERLRLAVEGGRIGIWDLDLKTGKPTWNHMMLELIGRDPEDSIPDLEDFFEHYIHEEDRPRLRKYFAKVLARESDFVDEFRVVREDGRVCWIASTGLVYRDDEGRPVRLSGVNYDISDRKQAEKEARLIFAKLEQRVLERTEELNNANTKLRERAEQLARLSSELTLTEQRERRRLADMLHENLQQFLIGVKMNLEILSSRLADEQRPHFDKAYDLLLETINISRSLTAELAPVVLEQQGLAAALIWLQRWMKEKYDFDLELRIDPEVNVYDENISVLLFQSVRELLTNVIKHAGVKMARIVLQPEEDDFLKLIVADRGKGFDPETTSRTASGLGLFSIRERLELLGGRMELESEPDRGTEVRMVAPAGEAATDQVEHKKRGRKKAPKKQEGSARKIRLMLADDHVVMRQALSAMLEQYDDIEIIGEASDGEEAIKLAAELVPDVILMDISMPRMDGLEATRLILAHNPDIRIIGLSMHERADQSDVMLRAGAAAFCSKTGDTENLVAEIRNGKKGF